MDGVGLGTVSKWSRKASRAAAAEVFPAASSTTSFYACGVFHCGDSFAISSSANDAASRSSGECPVGCAIVETDLAQPASAKQE